MSHTSPYNPHTATTHAVAPPRNANEVPRPGGHTAEELRSVSPMEDDRPKCEQWDWDTPQMHATVKDHGSVESVGWMPGEEWYGCEEEMPRGRRPG